MFSKNRNPRNSFFVIVVLVCGFVFASTVLPFAMGGKEEQEKSVPQLLAQTPTSTVTTRELGNLFWPDSNATEVQREEALKNLLGKKVTWEIVVAEVQRKDGVYLVQGQSSQEMIGTFVYIVPNNKEDEQKLIATGRDGTLTVTGLATEMQMRHIVLKPAMLVAPK